MPKPATPHSASDFGGRSVLEIGKLLMVTISEQADRKVFFRQLSQLLYERFAFDRLCINLYDQQGEMLTYFTAAAGVVVSTLSPIRPAEAASTVAGNVIASRKPVIITNFAQQFPGSPHPFAEAGLNATMAFPLTLNNEIIATLHCSFAETPDNIYEITSFLADLSPVVATCLGAILSLEHMRYSEKHIQLPHIFLPEFDDKFICCSKVMRDVMHKVNIVAKLNVPVLLLGETGTGKNIVAQTIHHRSPRKDGPFVKVNCPALPGTLFESELFGHVKGAFTGAMNKRIGRFELAHGGTLFLDEVAELSPEMQSKLLQVLDDASFERVGESVSLAADVRIVAATNVRLSEAFAQGRLRADFFHRLSLCTVKLPPLRERTEDIPPLVTAFAMQVADKWNLPVMRLSKAAMKPLMDYAWPGNIRELRNIMGKLAMENSGRPLTEAVVASALEESHACLNPVPEHKKEQPGEGRIEAMTQDAPITLADAERQHIVRAVQATGGVISGPRGAAALLGVPRSTLQYRIRKLGI